MVADWGKLKDYVEHVFDLLAFVSFRNHAANKAIATDTINVVTDTGDRDAGRAEPSASNDRSVPSNKLRMLLKARMR